MDEHEKKENGYEKRKIVQTKYEVPVRKAHKGNHICLYDFSFY